MQGWYYLKNRFQITLTQEFSEVKQIMNAIERLWHKPHVLAESQLILEWQHADKERNHFNIAVCRINGLIEAIVGYIPDNHFRRSIKNEGIALSFWVANPKYPGIGTYLMNAVISSYKCDFFVTGVSAEAAPIYARLGFALDYMTHVVWKSEDFQPSIWGSSTQQDLAKIRGERHNKTVPLKIYNLNRNSEIKWLQKWSKQYGGRNTHFLKNRYADHPIYIYQAAEQENGHNLIIFRIARTPFGNVMRIMEIFSENKEILCSMIFTILNDTRAQFADFYFGTSLKGNIDICECAIRVSPDTEMIFPDYLEPVVKKNIAIRWGWLAKGKKNIYVTRGDTDRDRPSGQSFF